MANSSEEVSVRTRYAAYCYMDEWLAIDREAHAVLSTTQSVKEACDWLGKVAGHYSVARNFPLSVAGQLTEAIRFEGVWHELQNISSAPNEEAMPEMVERVAKFGGRYEKVNLSAASKFLWMRFKKPFIIYDTITWRWMCTHGKLRDNGTYAQFCELWRREFEGRYGEEVKSACGELLEARRFFRPNDVSDEELRDAIESDWFQERVFDHFISASENAKYALSRTTSLQ